MLEIKKKDREKSDRLLRRFNRIIQQSGILSAMRKKKYHERKPTKHQVRQEAIRKTKIREIRRKKKEGY